jgi:hypothetical protein
MKSNRGARGNAIYIDNKWVIWVQLTTFDKITQFSLFLKLYGCLVLE